MDWIILVRLLIPTVLIGIGIWLKSSKGKESNKVERFWYAFVLIGLFLLVFRIIKYV